MEKQIICSNPTIITNPLLKELISKYLNVTIKGKYYSFRRSNLYFLSVPPCVPPPTKTKLSSKLVDGKIKVFREKIPIIKHEDLSSCYVIDRSSGEVFPVYIEVPCGHCELCKEAKINAFVERCRMESQCYDCLPWFVTLTYDDEHLPTDGVSVRDVQLFLKRFRINLERAGYDYKLRYVTSGEYGKTTHRAHYHLILWGLNSKTPEDFEKVSSILYNSWDSGYTMHRLIDASDTKTFYYTSKYLLKDNYVPLFTGDDGKQYPCNPPFCFSLDVMEV